MPLRLASRTSRTKLTFTFIHRHASTTSCSSLYPTRSTPKKQRLVVLGTGWAGYSFLKSLSYNTLRKFDVKVISPTTSFSFTPLLAQASCSTLDFRSAIEPIHSNNWMEVHHSWCDAIDFTLRRIELTPASNPQFRPPNPLSASEKSVAEEKRGNVEGEEKATYSMEYDYLIISVGSYNATFGTRGVKENALFLKDVNDARAIRWRILDRFELANARYNFFLTSSTTSSASGGEGEKLTAEQEKEVKELLSFIVVGGGPTGSEFAAELHDLINQDLTRLYPRLKPFPSIRLLDAGSTILSSFDSSLSEYAMKKFSRDGISIQLNAKISRVEKDAIYLSNPQAPKEGGKRSEEERVGAGMVVWSTGITTSPLIEALKGVGKEEKSGKLLTSNTLNVLVEKGSLEDGKLGGSVLNRTKQKQGKDEVESGELVEMQTVFAIGDCSSILSQPLPATAQVASQKGTFLANLFNNHITSSTSQEWKEAKGFRFLDKGSMASIGSNQALIDTPVKKESGKLAWILWRSAYTIMSMSWRNRFLVPANWASNLLFGRDVGRF